MNWTWHPTVRQTRYRAQSAVLWPLAKRLPSRLYCQHATAQAAFFIQCHFCRPCLRMARSGDHQRRSSAGNETGRGQPRQVVRDKSRARARGDQPARGQEARRARCRTSARASRLSPRAIFVKFFTCAKRSKAWPAISQRSACRKSKSMIWKPCWKATLPKMLKNWRKLLPATGRL